MHSPGEFARGMQKVCQALVYVREDDANAFQRMQLRLACLVFGEMHQRLTVIDKGGT